MSVSPETPGDRTRGSAGDVGRRTAELEARIRAAGFVVTLGGEVTSAVAAQVLGVSEGTLRNWRTSKNGPRYTRRNGRVWYSLDALVEFLALT